MLNQAIQQWDRGELVQSLETFNRVNTEYLDTAVATEAIKERAERLGDYQARSSSENNREINSGIVSRDVYQQIEDYYEQVGQYPEELQAGEDV